MRKHLIQILKELKALTGLNQYVTIASHPNRDHAMKELNDLLQPMINVCNIFNYIPDEDKARVIRKKILEDPDFTGLNAKKVYQYLHSVSERYFGEAHHLEVNKIQPVEPTEWKPETKALVDGFINSLKAGIAEAKLSGVEYEKKKIEKEEDEKANGKRALSLSYHPLSANEILRRELHAQYVRESYHPITMEPREGFMLEDKWLETHGYYEIEGVLVKAGSLDEAREKYLTDIEQP